MNSTTRTATGRQSSLSTALGPTPPASAARSAPCTIRATARSVWRTRSEGWAATRRISARSCGRLRGPMVLVAHSYGGAVISNAATGND
jgi:hypothetical protein